MSDPNLPAESDLPDGPDLGGGFDMGALLGQAMEMQQQLAQAQAEAAEAVVEGQAGGGAVSVRVTGGLVFESVTIAPGAVDPDDVDLLQDLVLAALNDAMDQIARLQQASMGGLPGLGDLGLGDLGGLFASPDDLDDDDDVIDAEVVDET